MQRGRTEYPQPQQDSSRVRGAIIFVPTCIIRMCTLPYSSKGATETKSTAPRPQSSGRWWWWWCIRCTEQTTNILRDGVWFQALQRSHRSSQLGTVLYFPLRGYGNQAATTDHLQLHLDPRPPKETHFLQYFSILHRGFLPPRYIWRFSRREPPPDNEACTTSIHT